MAEAASTPTPETRQRIGFIGVGLMGHGMAKNILKAGYPTTVMGHHNRKPVEDLKKRGAREAKTPKALAAASDVIFICVTSSVQVEDLIRRKDGIAAGARKGMIIVDCSTADPTSTLALHKELKKQGVTLIDAPLGNTPKEAEEGKLNAFVGSDPKTMKIVRPIIETWAENIIHVGGVGAGHKAKLINNFVAMSYVAIYAEAYTACDAAGVDKQKFFDLVRPGGLYCGLFQRISNWAIGKDPNAHKFAIANSTKDLRYFNNMAEASGMTSLMGHAALHNFMYAMAQGKGEEYMPRLVDVVAEVNHVARK
jgi:3-hydroxyisobutyrate dehydrogenase-like beta-hydroxyacid dehydrogenase